MDNKKSETFAQKLNNHNKFLEKNLKQIKQLLSQPRSAESIEEIKKLHKSTETVIQEFDYNHKKELDILDRLYGQSDK